MTDRKRIWWIASYPKSGSTWVRMVINAYVTGFPPNINSAWQYATGDLQGCVYQLTAARSIHTLDDADKLYYRPAVLLNHVLMSEPNDCCLKTHHAKVERDGIPLIPPRLTKGALYIVRDPRDVVVSFADHLGIPIDKMIEQLANNQMMLTGRDGHLAHILCSWSTHVDSWTVQNKSPFPTAAVRYEDMLATPDVTWPLVLEALGLFVDEIKLNNALSRAAFHRLQEQEDAHGFREKGKGERFFRQGKAGGWRDVLTSQQARRIEQNHRHTMERWGYLEAKRKGANTLGRIRSQAAGTVS